MENKNLLKEIIKLRDKYQEKLKISNNYIEELDKELEENDGEYLDIEFGQDYESEESFNLAYSNIVDDLNKLINEIKD